MSDQSTGGRRYVSDVAFTDTIKAWQEREGSREGYAEYDEKEGWSDTIDEQLAAFIAERDSFYFGTANNEGQPYIQHRGGPKGFLKVLDEKKLGFADFGGSKQYISVGNVADNEKAHIFLMDYANKRRLKIWGRATVTEDDKPLLLRLSTPRGQGKPERAVLFHVEAVSWACPGHITQRFSLEQMQPTLDKLKARISELEAELAASQSSST
jgi:predicted pyridoxine 5'-phosphate oxidase superfamily flavin-nucleotide-binding protein